MTPSDRPTLGRLGEELARLYYEAEGYAVLARRWRTREGELDLVVRRRGDLAFVEVKTRRGDACGGPAVAVTPRKLRRMRLVARRYLAREGAAGATRFRFDVAAVSLRADGCGCRLEILPGVS
ncbi:YraN family protein [bacterium]|nr:YraN family protein [bacterium]